MADAERSLQLANARYTGGLVTYLDVITAEEQALSNEREETQLSGPENDDFRLSGESARRRMG